MRPFIKSESWPVVGFYPHVTSTGVFMVNLNTLYPNLGSFKGGVQRNEPGNQTIMLYHSHLAIEVYDFKNFGEAPGIWRAEFGALSRPGPDEAGSSL